MRNYVSAGLIQEMDRNHTNPNRMSSLETREKMNWIWQSIFTVFSIFAVFQYTLIYSCIHLGRTQIIELLAATKSWPTLIIQLCSLIWQTSEILLFCMPLYRLKHLSPSTLSYAQDFTQNLYPLECFGGLMPSWTFLRPLKQTLLPCTRFYVSVHFGGPCLPFMGFKTNAP